MEQHAQDNGADPFRVLQAARGRWPWRDAYRHSAGYYPAVSFELRSLDGLAGRLFRLAKVNLERAGSSEKSQLVAAGGSQAFSPLEPLWTRALRRKLAIDSVSLRGQSICAVASAKLLVKRCPATRNF